MEQWKEIEGHPAYMVSNLGRVKGKNGKILKSGYARGYLNVVLDNKTYPVHRLVAKAFVAGYAEGLVVNHIDECKHHNFAFNLEWVTQAKNVEHSLAITFKVINPQGVIFEGKNASVFAREHGLCPRTFRKMLAGQISHHKGWKKWQ